MPNDLRDDTKDVTIDPVGTSTGKTAVLYHMALRDLLGPAKRMAY